MKKIIVASIFVAVLGLCTLTFFGQNDHKTADLTPPISGSTVTSA